MAVKSETGSASRERYYYGTLLVSLLFLLLLYPIADYAFGNVSMPILNGLVLVVLFAAIYAASRERPRVFYVSILLAVLAMAAHGVDIASDAAVTAALRAALTSLFYLFIAAVIAVHVLRARRVTTDILLGATCVYLMLGLGWSSLFEVVELVWPGSFSSAQPLFLGSVEEGTLRVTGFNYYSFVTLSTLGYGDISPVTPPARAFAWMEAVVGQMYLVIAVARLVSLHATASPVKDD